MHFHHFLARQNLFVVSKNSTTNIFVATLLLLCGLNWKVIYAAAVNPSTFLIEHEPPDQSSSHPPPPSPLHCGSETRDKTTWTLDTCNTSSRIVSNVHNWHIWCSSNLKIPNLIYFRHFFILNHMFQT